MPVSMGSTEKRDAFTARLGAAALATLELQTVYLGDRLGLYRTLAEQGPATAPELADRAGVDARYAREWLEQQAVAGILDVDDPKAEADTRRYTLSSEHAEVLLDAESLALAAPLARFLVGSSQVMPALLDAFRTGGGIDWADYGPDAIESQEAMNRPQFAHHIRSWINDLTDIAGRLREDGGSIADLACGAGWSSIWMARLFPGVHVDGIDIDQGSIDRAKANAKGEGIGEEVTFRVANAADTSGDGSYDLVTIFEAVHDMARPVEVLTRAHRLLKPDGAVLIADERVAETFTAPGDEVERMHYGFSVTCCLPCGLADPPSVGTGTVLRPSVLQAMAKDAGFSGFTILPTEHDSFSFYRLDP